MMPQREVRADRRVARQISLRSIVVAESRVWMEFPLKQIYFPILDKNVSMVMQNENGPCPLIALSNILSLRGLVTLTGSRIAQDELVSAIGELILTSSSEPDTDVDKLIIDLQTLHVPLDVNVYFKSCFKLETNADKLFDFFNIKTCHAWTVDPQNQALYEIIQEYGCYSSLLVSLSAQNDLKQEIIHDFLNDSSHQATAVGLLELSGLENNQLCIFFRGNHFSVLVKYKDSLYTLVTDAGFLDNSEIVWESIAIHGDSSFFNSDFLNGSNQDDHAADLALALSLQDTEDQVQYTQRNAQYTKESQKSVQEQEKHKCLIM